MGKDGMGEALKYIGENVNGAVEKNNLDNMLL